MIDPADFPEFHTVAEKMVERHDRGLPVDRWVTSNDDMVKVVNAYRILFAMWASLTEALAKAEFERGLEAMKMEGE